MNVTLEVFMAGIQREENRRELERLKREEEIRQGLSALYGYFRDRKTDYIHKQCMESKRNRREHK